MPQFSQGVNHATDFAAFGALDQHDIAGIDKMMRLRREFLGGFGPVAAHCSGQGMVQGLHARADAMHQRNSRERRMAGNIGVKRGFGRAQFQHVAENGDAAAKRDTAGAIGRLTGGQ